MVCHEEVNRGVCYNRMKAFDVAYCWHVLTARDAQLFWWTVPAHCVGVDVALITI